ncbi:hypothetical protein D915_009669 [Fasciola hepatica]|uniref:C-type lectin domain-containing protein n=1 Tax=Fasciola hepatica TaxID=6192 RepID=A0A4E0R283_FASHE|nr:hypothetical protein D915_009669 [Fasciola hepatica]
MSAKYLVIIILVGNAVIFPFFVTPSTICPENFVEAGGNVCMIRLDREVTYCEAHRICEQEGTKRGLRLFIPGYHAPKITSLFSNLTNVYTSYSATLNRSSDLRAGWRVGDPGFAQFVTTSDDTTIPWHIGQPNNFGQPIALYIGSQLFDDLQSNLNATSVICEVSHRPISGKLERFQTNWPYQLDTLFVRGDTQRGCFNSIIASTSIECAKR